jgi:hypothetical protein
MIGSGKGAIQANLTKLKKIAFRHLTHEATLQLHVRYRRAYWSALSRT